MAEAKKPRKPRKRKPTKKEAQAAEARVRRQARVMDLRMAGATYAQIAAKITQETGEKVSEPTVWRDVQGRLADLNEYTRHKTEEYRALELHRLDKLWFAQWVAAMEGNPVAVDLLLKISAARAKLLGLNNDKLNLKVELEREVEQMLTSMKDLLDDDLFQKVLLAISDAGGETPGG